MWSIVNKIRRLFSPKDKKRLVQIVGLMTLATGGEFLGISLLVGIIALFLNPEILEKNELFLRYYNWLGLSWNSFVILNVSVVGFAMVVKNLFSLLIVYYQSKFIYEKQQELTVRLFCSYLKAPYIELLKCSHSERGTHIYRANLISNFVLLPFMQIISDLLVVAVLGIVMICYIPYIALGSILFFSLVGAIIYYTTRTANIRYGTLLQQNHLQGERIQYAGLFGIKTVKSLGAESYFGQNYAQKQQEKAHYNNLLYTIGQFPRLLLESSAMILLLAIFVILLVMSVSKEEILLIFTMIIAVVARILPALSRCHYNIMVIRQNQYLFEDVADKINDIESEAMGDEVAPIELKEELEIRDLSFSYDGKTDILEHFSLKIPINTSIGIKGKTGSGKTTFVDLVMGLLRPTSGDILVDNRSIFKNLKSWRSQIGYVSQDLFMTSGTVSENVALGVASENIDYQKVQESLEVAQMGDWLKTLPEGLATKIDENGTNLSGGQRQRINIARALYLNPKLLIMDEATSALDNETEAAFIDTLENLKGKLTMIVIAHRLSTIEKCDKHINIGY